MSKLSNFFYGDFYRGYFGLYCVAVAIAVYAYVNQDSRWLPPIYAYIGGLLLLIAVRYARLRNARPDRGAFSHLLSAICPRLLQSNETVGTFVEMFTPLDQLRRR